MMNDWDAWVSSLRQGDIVWTLGETTFYDHPFTRASTIPQGTPLLFLEYMGNSKNWLRVIHSGSSLEVGIIRESEVGDRISA